MSVGKDTAMKRLNRELEEMKKNPPTFCTAGPVNRNLFHWQATIVGPPGSPYRGGFFKLDMVFTDKFPMEPPSVKFRTKIYHVNILNDGRICLDILSYRWSPSISVGNLLLTICNLLSTPNPDDPFDREKAVLYKFNKAAYIQNATEMTRLYAV